MKKDNIFFGENGLTATSANHLANVAKEMIADVEKELEDLCFFNHDTYLVSASHRLRISTGSTEEDCKAIPEKLQQIIEMKQFISWIREALKAKDRLAKDVRNRSNADILQELGMTEPEEPEYPHQLTEDEYIATLSVKERNRIYSLQTEAATLGQAVHTNGFLSKARKTVSELVGRKGDTFNQVEASDNHVRVEEYTLSCPREAIEEMFFHLQNEYREAQARLNAAMHEITEAVALENERRANEKQQLFARYSDKRQAMQMAIDGWKEKELRRISQLRIVLPNDLMTTYQKVSSVGK